MKTFRVPGLAWLLIPFCIILFGLLAFAYFGLFLTPVPEDERLAFGLSMLAGLVIVVGVLLFSTYRVNVYDGGDVELISLLGRKRLPVSAFRWVADWGGALLCYQGGIALLPAHPLLFRELLDLVYVLRQQNPQFRILGVFLPSIYSTIMF
jgi:hypothetical protein